MRWIERHTTVQNIAHAYEALTDCLTNIILGENGWDAKSITEPNGYYPVFVVPSGLLRYMFILSFRDTSNH